MLDIANIELEDKVRGQESEEMNYFEERQGELIERKEQRCDRWYAKVEVLKELKELNETKAFNKAVEKEITSSIVEHITKEDRT